MQDPVIADRKPVVMELDPGVYWWCACGMSKTQPWCDGSHQGSGHNPIEVAVAERKRYAMCCCKHSANKPYCDGAHKDLAAPGE